MELALLFPKPTSVNKGKVTGKLISYPKCFSQLTETVDISDIKFRIQWMCSYLIYIVQGEWLIQNDSWGENFKIEKQCLEPGELSAGALAFQTGLGIPFTLATSYGLWNQQEGSQAREVNLEMTAASFPLTALEVTRNAATLLPSVKGSNKVEMAIPWPETKG